MYDERIIEGWIDFECEPDWEPLERLLPLGLCGGFMYMDRVLLNEGPELSAYKHSETRLYVLVDAQGDTWERLGRGRYRRMRHSDAIEQVFPTSWVLEQATDGDRIALKEALGAAWERRNGDQGAGAHILPSSPASRLRQLP
jgi:hypothetical protein